MAEINSDHIPEPPAEVPTQDTADVQMTDADEQSTQQTILSATQPEQPQSEQAQSSAPGIAPQSQQQQPTTTAASPAPAARTATPAREPGSRAASVHPEQQQSKMPAGAANHGAPVRQYLNSKVSGVLLEGMKKLAKERPKDPLRVLGEYLLQRSKEMEGPAASSSST